MIFKVGNMLEDQFSAVSSGAGYNYFAIWATVASHSKGYGMTSLPRALMRNVKEAIIGEVGDYDT